MAWLTWRRAKLTAAVTDRQTARRVTDWSVHQTEGCKRSNAFAALL